MTESAAPDLSRFHTIDDFEEAARAILPQMAYDYYRSGAGAENTLNANRRALDEYEIWYRVLVDVESTDITTSILNTRLTVPVVVAPTAYHRMAHQEGELAAARAAARAGTIFILSTLATTSIEDVAASSDGPKWFQLYVHTDRGLTKSLVERAEASAFKAIVLTVDAPLLGRRIADERNQFTLPEGMSMANVADALIASDEGSGLADYVATRHDATLNWNDLEWIRSMSSLPLVIKGIVRADDARRAIDAGVDAIVVSNHGGRQLDGAPASIDALAEVAGAVGDECPLLMDGGIRWGTDVLRALALGAKAVLVGRPILWGLAVAGADGVERVLDLLRVDFATSMALAGCPSVDEIPADLVRKRSR